MRLTIRVKLIWGFLIVVGMLLIVAVVGFNGVNKWLTALTGSAGPRRWMTPS